MIMNENESKVLKDLWKIKEEAYDEVAHHPTLKDKIHSRILISKESVKNIKKMHLH